MGEAWCAEDPTTPAGTTPVLQKGWLAWREDVACSPPWVQEGGMAAPCPELVIFHLNVRSRFLLASPAHDSAHSAKHQETEVSADGQHTGLWPQPCRPPRPPAALAHLLPPHPCPVGTLQPGTARPPRPHLLPSHPRAQRSLPGSRAGPTLQAAGLAPEGSLAKKRRRGQE